MIVGIGTDLCDIRRIKATLARRGDRFAEKVLGPEEFQVYLRRKARVEARGISYLATRFAAKEAFSKAIGLGMHWPMTWRHVQVLNEPSGRPALVLRGELLPWFEARGWKAHVTVTDEVEHAVAFVVVETDPAAPSSLSNPGSVPPTP